MKKIAIILALAFATFSLTGCGGNDKTYVASEPEQPQPPVEIEPPVKPELPIDPVDPGTPIDEGKLLPSFR